jgi:hypothetical protein
VARVRPIPRCYRHAFDDPVYAAVNRAHLGALQRLIGALPWLPQHAAEYWLDASRYGG